MNHRLKPWRFFGLIAAMLSPLVAWSASPTAGSAAFVRSCASCHTVASTAVDDRGRNSPALIQSAISSVSEMNGLSLSAGDLDDIAAFLGNAPGALSFPQTNTGQTSGTQTVTVRSSGSAALGSLAVGVSGDFARVGGTCGNSLAASSSCTIAVAFSPTTVGARSGTLSITHNGISTPIAIGLAGTGSPTTQPTISLDASTLAFGSRTIGASSAGSVLTVSNTGTAALTFSAITLGGAAPADYAVTGECAVDSPLAAGAQCTLTARFAPRAVGSRAATLTIASNASNGNAVVSLSGTGQSTPAPQVSLSASAVAFGGVTVGAASLPHVVTLLNSGDADLSLQGVTTADPFAVTHGCGASLAAGASCSISVSFVPAAAGAASGTLDVASNAGGSPQHVALSGIGVLANAGLLQWSDTTPIDFGSVAVGNDSARHVLTLSNIGGAAASAVSVVIAGPQASEFVLDVQSTCVSTNPSAGTAQFSLPVGGTCTVEIVFDPAGAGLRAANVSVSSSDAGTPQAVALKGVGTASLPVLSLSATSLNFDSTTTGGAPPQPFILSNAGTVDLHISSLSSDNARFTIVSPADNSCAAGAFTLAPGASCIVDVGWSGGATDPRENATLIIAGDMLPATVDVALTGSGKPSQVANAGGGGCTIAAGTPAVDPVLIFLTLIAAVLLWRRRQQSGTECA